MAEQKLKNSIKVSIFSAENKLYEKEAAALSSYNEEGKFDILPYHANFISIVTQGVTVHEIDGGEKEFPLEVAVLKAFENTIDVYLGIESVDLEGKGLITGVTDTKPSKEKTQVQAKEQPKATKEPTT